MKIPHGSPEEVSWAASLVPRLRALQASFADDSAADRETYLAQELKQALDKIPATRRAGHLELLAGYFPVWDENSPAPAPATPAPTPAEIASPSDLVDRLCSLASTLSDEERREFGERLSAAGIAPPLDSGMTLTLPPEQAPATVALPPELQKRLAIRPDETLDLERVLRLIAALAEFAVTIEQPTWSLWKSLAPQSTLRRDPNADLRKIAGPYLVGDREVSTTQITQSLERTRHLIAGLLAAIGTTGESFARQFLSRFSPEAIKSAADAESGFFLGPEQKCWRQYVAQFNEISGVAIEQEISKIIAQNAESLIQGPGAATE